MWRRRVAITMSTQEMTTYSSSSEDQGAETAGSHESPPFLLQPNHNAAFIDAAAHPGVANDQVVPLYSRDPIVSVPYQNNTYDRINDAKAVEDDTNGNGCNLGEGFGPFWSNINENLPLCDESIWAEAAMSIDFPVLDDIINLGDNKDLVDESGSWYTPQSPWHYHGRLFSVYCLWAV